MAYGLNLPVVLQIPITTNASGDFTFTTGEPVSGRFVQYRYVPADSDALDANWDLDVVGDTTGVVLIDEDNLAATAVQKAIGQILHDNTGAAVKYDGTNDIYAPGIWVADEHVTVTVGEGGNVQSGTLYLWYMPA